MFNKSNNPIDNPKGNTTPYPTTEGHPLAQQPTYGRGLETTAPKPSIISEEVVLTGNIKTPGALHIEGVVIGDLEVSSLVIGPTGRFEGNVKCKTMNVRGRFTGTSICRELMVASSAQIDAKITYQDLTLQRGAGLRGELHVANYVE